MTIAASHADKTPSRVLWRLAVLAGYPLVVGISMALDVDAVRALALPLLALALIGGLPNSRVTYALMAGALVLAAWVVALPGLALWPAGLIGLVAGAWFGRSLATPQPLIRRFALEMCRQAGRSLPSGAEGWFRAWTLIWSLLLVGLGAGALVLAARQQPQAWLIWVAGLMPAVCVLAFLAEFYLRRLWFPGERRWPLPDFLFHLVRVRPEQMMR